MTIPGPLADPLVSIADVAPHPGNLRRGNVPLFVGLT